jgi:hypothetical protein
MTTTNDAETNASRLMMCRIKHQQVYVHNYATTTKKSHTRCIATLTGGLSGRVVTEHYSIYSSFSPKISFTLSVIALESSSFLLIIALPASVSIALFTMLLTLFEKLFMAS